MSFTDMIMAALKFDKEGLAKVAKDDNMTMPALIMIGISVLVSGFAMMLGGTNPYLNMGGDNADVMTGINGLLIGIIIQILMNFLVAWLIAIFLKMFGGRTTTMEVLRVMGAVSIWGIIGSILPIISLGSLAWVFSLIGFIALLFGISSYSGKGMFVIFLAILVAYIVVVIVIMALVVGVIVAILA